MPLGFMLAISSTVFSSFLKTTCSQPRSPRYCDTLCCAFIGGTSVLAQCSCSNAKSMPSRSSTLVDVYLVLQSYLCDAHHTRNLHAGESWAFKDGS